MKICKTKRCRRKVKSRADLCDTCYSREWRKKNPEKAAYTALKNNAKRRKIPFSLTYEEFLSFAKSTNYVFGKGRDKDSLSIDKIIDRLGYVVGNLQVLTVSENSKKYQRTKNKMLTYTFDENGVPQHFRFIDKTIEDSTETPF